MYICMFFRFNGKTLAINKTRKNNMNNNSFKSANFFFVKTLILIALMVMGGGVAVAQIDLTASMFHEWTGVGADATIKTQTVGCGYDLSVSTGMPYGNSNVLCTHYADLSLYGKLEVTASTGEPRFCFNRQVNEGDVPLEFPRDKTKYPDVEEVVDNGDGTKTYIVDLQTIVAEAGFAHLNCIKGANYQNITVTSMKLSYVTKEPITTPINLVFTSASSKTFDIRYFKVSGEGVTIDYNTDEVTATKAGGKIYVEFSNADLSAAKSIVLGVNTASPYADICGTGEIFNEGTSINAWYGSRYNMQNLDQEASINQVAQGYNWNEKMGSVTKVVWNIDKAGTMKINNLTITSGVPGLGNDDETFVPVPDPAGWQVRRVVDNKHPMWMIHIDVWNNADPQKIIDLIPEDIKPFVVMNLSMSCQYDTTVDRYKKPQSALQTYRSWASVCCRNNMWFTCQPASGGHTHIPDNAANYENALEIHESFFRDYKNFLGWNYAEQFWGFNEPGDESSSSDADRIKLFADLVPMHHKYGGFLTISFCGNIWSHKTNPVAMLKRSPKLLAASQAYPEAILWLYKYTTSANWYNNESVTIGPFVSGLAKNYGVRYDNCGWNGVLNNDAKNGMCDGDGITHFYPGAVGIAPVMEQMALNGACVWDGPELIWTECFKEGNATNVDGYTRRRWVTYPNFDNIWVDMFRKVIDGTIHIASREEVLARTKIVMKNDISATQDPTSLKVQAYATPLNLYHGLYHQDDPFNSKEGHEDGYGTLKGYGNNNYLYFKKTGRYATIPVVIDNFDDKAKNANYQTLNHSTYLSQYKDNMSAKVDLFDSAYPEVSTGDLFVGRNRNEMVCYFPFSFMKEEERGVKKVYASAQIPLKYNTCSELDLKFGQFGSAIVSEYADHIDFYMNNYRADTVKVWTDDIVVKGAKVRPTYTLTGNRCDATITEEWRNNEYILHVSHCGPLDFTIDCEGNATDRSTEYLDHTALVPEEIEKPEYEPMQPLIIEGEDFDYRNIKKCVTDAWNDFLDWNDGHPELPYQRVYGHSAMGFVDMGSSTQGSLRNNTVLNSAGKYQVDVKYLSTEETNVTLKINDETFPLPLPATTNDINALDAWRTVTVTTDMKKGKNTIVLNNDGGKLIYIDNVKYTPIELWETMEGPGMINKLTADMFFEWTAADATGKKKQEAGCAYVMNESTDMPYGDGSVGYLKYADLSNADKLYVTVTEGQPRILMNRQSETQDPVEIEYPRLSYDETIENTDGSITYIVDVKAIVEKYGYAHLNAIKGANWQNTTVTAMYYTLDVPTINEDLFDFDEFIAYTNATFNREEHSLSGNGGWTFDTPVDLTDYKYVVITSGRNRRNSGSTKVAVTFDGKTIQGDDNKENGGYIASRQGLWLDTWNNNSLIVLEMDKLKDGNYDISKLNSLQFFVPSDEVLYINNVYATNTLPNYTDGDYYRSVSEGGRYGTICLPYDAAYSGCFVYEIAGKDSENIYLDRVDGLMQAGKSYFYCSTHNYPDKNNNNAVPQHKVLFYKAGNYVAPQPIASNGLVGTFEDDGNVPKAKGMYIVNSNNLYIVNDVNVSYTANHAYIDIKKVPNLSSGGNAKVRIGYYGEADDNTAIATKDEEAAQVVGIYSASGVKLNALQKGLNIVKMSDNTVKKIIIK